MRQIALKPKVLVVIPARAESKRIPRKNIKKFLGKPLIAYAIDQARALGFADRVIVDTDSEKIAAIVEQYGAEVPFLRPKRLARDASVYIDSLLCALARLEKEESYIPTHVLILQTTSPLREIEDIKKCWSMMQKGGATTVLTVCPTHPKLYHLTKDNDLELMNGTEAASNNTQEWEPGYILNGCAYIVDTAALTKEKRIITKRTKAVVCDRWRSVDVDTREDWVVAELFYKHMKAIKARIKKI